MTNFEELLKMPVPTSGMLLFQKKAFYRWYIRTKFWMDRRSKHIVAHPTCQLEEVLGTFSYAHEGALQVHHRNYERVGNEMETDLLTLCRHCHARFHEKIVIPTWAGDLHQEVRATNFAVSIPTCKQVIVQPVEVSTREAPPRLVWPCPATQDYAMGANGS